MESEVSMYQIYLNNYLILFGGVIFYYDWLLTLPKEVKYVWLAPRTAGVWIFLLNRYYNFFAYITTLVPTFAPFKEIKACDSYILYSRMSLIVGVLIIGVTLIQRTYVLYQRDNRVLALMVSVAVGLLGLSGIMVANGGYRNPRESTPFGLGSARTELTLFSRDSKYRAAIAWESLFAFDTMIFLLTVVRTLRGRNLSVAGVNEIPEMMFRHGALYFA
ncbi:hypothetical protein NLI96_g3121 [Meripilus lineatus]|uniref:DUF6533 domain-containing protein n=1 Tax=Meripilus lineatus TaxID=2056292 RepID=A0AAD5V7A3_9APHY|nr:hypothetical protein NLI96_g3121 [Physisporinus lineatus]